MKNGIVANSAFNAAAGMLLLAVGFLSSIITARLLGPDANGMIAFSLWLASTGALVAELGTGILLLRLLPELKAKGASDEARKQFAAYLLWPVLGVTFILLICYFLVFNLAATRHWAETQPPVVLVTGLLFVLQAIGMFAKNYLIGEQRVGIFFKMTQAAGVMQFLGVLIGALFFGVAGALFGYCLAYISQFIYALRLLRYRPHNGGQGLRALMQSGLLLSAELMIDSIFLNRIELFFLERYHGITIVGFYAVAFSLTNLALQLPIQLSGSLVPFYAEKRAENPGKPLQVELFASVARSLAYFTLPMSFGLSVIAPRLITLVFGQPYAQGGTMLTVLALSVPSAVACQVATQYLFATDRIRQRLYVGIGAAFAMVLGDVLLVPHFGGEGAGLVRLVVFTGMSLAMLRWMQFEGSLSGLGKSLLLISLAALAASLCAAAVLFFSAGIAGLILAIVCAILVYALSLRLLRAVPAGDIAVLEGFLHRLPQPFATKIGSFLGLLVAKNKNNL